MPSCVVHRLLAAALLLGVAAVAAQTDTGAVAEPAAALHAADSGAAVERAVALRVEAIALEHGEGVRRDPAAAAARYCAAARLGDAEAQYRLGWMHANGRGVSRDDALAAWFFRAAAEQGLPQAVAMLARVGEPVSTLPGCLREPAVAPPIAAEPAPPLAPPVAWKAPKPLLALVEAIAPRYSVAPQLALTIMEAESRFNPMALSPKNAVGLMQLIPETSARFNVTKPYDPAQNIRGGVAYLRWLLAYFEGDVALVAAAYNAGERTVERYRGVPPYAETRAYVQRVLRGVGTRVQPFDAKATPASPQLASIRQARAFADTAR